MEVNRMMDPQPTYHKYSTRDKFKNSDRIINRILGFDFEYPGTGQNVDFEGESYIIRFAG
jgi:hypothetical protein